MPPPQARDQCECGWRQVIPSKAISLHTVLRGSPTETNHLFNPFQSPVFTSPGPLGDRVKVIIGPNLCKRNKPEVVAAGLRSREANLGKLSGGCGLLKRGSVLGWDQRGPAQPPPATDGGPLALSANLPPSQALSLATDPGWEKPAVVGYGSPAIVGTTGPDLTAPQGQSAALRQEAIRRDAGSWGPFGVQYVVSIWPQRLRSLVDSGWRLHPYSKDSWERSGDGWAACFSTTARPRPWPQPTHRGRAWHGKRCPRTKAWGTQASVWGRDDPPGIPFLGAKTTRPGDPARDGFPLGPRGTRPRMENPLGPRGGEPELSEGPGPRNS